MELEEQRKKLETLPWQALFDIAIQKQLAEPTQLNAFKTINGQSLLNIWTFTAFDAEELCINFVSRGNNYAYGTSKQMNCDFEHDKTLYPHKIYFQHYHVHSGKNFFTMNKVKDIHILFGAPIKNNNKT